MIEILRIAGVILVSILAVASLRVLFDLVRAGPQRVREVREEGGGVIQKFRGELDGGQRTPSTARAHGLHMTVRGGQVHFREKSVIAKEAA